MTGLFLISLLHNPKKAASRRPSIISSAFLFFCFFQASGTFKFPDLFPKDEVEDDKSAETDTRPGKATQFQWF